jgi:deoxyadenosine/deoxycytidine kinase
MGWFRFAVYGALLYPNLYMKKKPFVILAGNLGAGKTTLAKTLSRHFGWWVGLESVNDNPYLKDFYLDMVRWSFHLQIYFLGNRLHLHKTAASQPAGAILDRSIYEDRHIFAEALHRKGMISSREYESYTQLFDLVVKSLPEPDLIIYVYAPVSVLIERIKRRNQPFDRDLSPDYLKMIDNMYGIWTSTLPRSQLLTIDSTIADFNSDQNNSPELASIIEHIASMLK